MSNNLSHWLKVCHSVLLSPYLVLKQQNIENTDNKPALLSMITTFLYNSSKRTEIHELLLDYVSLFCSIPYYNIVIIHLFIWSFKSANSNFWNSFERIRHQSTLLNYSYKARIYRIHSESTLLKREHRPIYIFSIPILLWFIISSRSISKSNSDSNFFLISSNYLLSVYWPLWTLSIHLDTKTDSYGYYNGCIYESVSYCPIKWWSPTNI